MLKVFYLLLLRRSLAADDAIQVNSCLHFFYPPLPTVRNSTTSVTFVVIVINEFLIPPITTIDMVICHCCRYHHFHCNLNMAADTKHHLPPLPPPSLPSQSFTSQSSNSCHHLSPVLQLSFAFTPIAIIAIPIYE